MSCKPDLLNWKVHLRGREIKKVAEQNFAELTRVKLSVAEWERRLIDS